MTQEEKVKAHDKFVEELKSKFKDFQVIIYNKNDLEKFFPELRESEDEKIRKDIIVLVKDWWDRVNKDNISTKEQMIAWLEKQGEQKPAEEYNITGISSNKSQGKLGEIIKKIKHSWSEEDEVGLANAMWAIEQARTIAKDENDMGNLWYAERWLKSLKDRVQLKQEWSEKDENLFECAIDAVKQESKVRTDGCLDEEVGEKVINWLKSLRPQSQWKPSGEQMEFVWKYAEQNNYDGKVFTRLYNDLKKLKGE